MSPKQTDSIFRQKLELLVLCRDSKIKERAQEVASHYSFSLTCLSDEEFDGYFSDLNVVRPQVTLICQETDEATVDFGRRAHELLVRFPKSCIVAVLGRDSSHGDVSSLQNLHIVPLSEAEFFETTKFEYACLYRTRAQYVDIQRNEVFPGTTIPFSVYIKLPLNQKYLAVIFADTVLTDERFQKITNESDHLLIDLGEAAQYSDYISSFFDQAGIGLRKRSRALFLSFCHRVLLLQESLVFNHKSLPVRVTEELFIKIKDLLYELVDLMKREGDLWDVFRAACQNEFFAQWRAPWIAVYSALMSAKSGVGDPIHVALAALLTDLGLYDVPRSSFLEFLKHGAAGLHMPELASVRKHPVDSLERVQARGIPLEDDIQKMLITVHEHADGSGFPSGLKSEEIPLEAAIIRFAELIDFHARSQTATTDFNFRALRGKLASAEEQRGEIYPPQFFQKISKGLL